MPNFTLQKGEGCLDSVVEKAIMKMQKTQRHTRAVVYAENFHGGWLVQGHMVVICIWCSLFVTSQFNVISMFPNQRFGEVS